VFPAALGWASFVIALGWIVSGLVVVTDSGSVMSNGQALVVGAAAERCQLVVSNAGIVKSGSGYIGDGSTGKNNLVLVTGAGSLWTNSGIMSVGSGGRSNHLTVANAGTVAVSGVLYLGETSGSIGSTITLTGGNIIVTAGNVTSTGTTAIVALNGLAALIRRAGWSRASTRSGATT